MVSDSGNSIVFTLITDVQLPLNGDTVDVEALQGVITDYTVNGDTLITIQHLAIETHTRAAVYFNCGNGDIRKFLISHQGILEFNEPISFYGLYFEKDIEALITYTT